MCDICEKHRKNVKWYLDPDNYKDELVLNNKARMKVIEDITGYRLEYYVYNTSRLSKLFQKLGPLKYLLKPLVNKKAYELHGGQVVPLEDALQIVEIAHNHVLIPCYCRYLFGGETELTCLNFGLVKDLWPKYKPQDPIEEVSKKEAARLLEEWDRKGYVHGVFWAKIPYVIAICNCEKKYCSALRNALLYGIENSYKKSHYIAVIDPGLCDLCNGNPKCVLRCQFNAIRFKPSSKTIIIDASLCYGCGLCREACDRGAIKLVERSSLPK